MSLSLGSNFRMRVLVTGASGMVGKNIIEQSSQFDVELVTPPSRELNLLCKTSVEDFFKDNSVDAVIHCAGLVGGIQANIANPVKFFYDNMQMGLNIIMGAREAGIQKLINLGSSCMYPRDAQNPLKESSVLKGELEPTNEGYAIAKVGASRLCNYIVQEHSDFAYKTLIPCNLYGRHDKFSKHNSHMIPAVIDKVHSAAKNGVDKVEIWGDGTARREFMYAGDLAEIILQALANIRSLPQVLNIGLGYDYSINEYYEAIANVVGFKGSFVHDLTKPVGMRQKLVDVIQMHNQGWKSKTSLKDGVRQTYNFYLEQQ